MDFYLNRLLVVLSFVLLGTFLFVLRRGVIHAWFLACRLRWRSARWVTLDLGCVKVRHSQDVFDTFIAQRLDTVFREEVARLAGWFGRPLPKPPLVYLFPTTDQVGGYVEGAAGVALQMRDWVIAPLDLEVDDFRRLLRHELVHLHSYWFAGRRSPLMEEGLARLLERVVNHWSRKKLPPLDLWKWDVQPPLRRWPPLSLLLDRQYFYDLKRRYVNYDTAASFSAFLIQRHGWDKYLAFYKRGRGWLFYYHFRRTFGVSFVRAEREWRAGRWAVQLPATD